MKEQTDLRKNRTAQSLVYCLTASIIMSFYGLTACASEKKGLLLSSNSSVSTSQSIDESVVKNLRKDIDATFESTKNLTRDESGKYLTAVISKYIPKGSSFAYTEALLSRAGFIIDTDPFYFPKRPGRHSFGDQAVLHGVGSDWPRSSVSVLIFAEDIKTYAKVDHLTATFETVLP